MGSCRVVVGACVRSTPRKGGEEMKLDWLDFAWDRVETLKNTFDVLPDINDEAQVECAEDMVKLLRELADVIEWNM